MKQLHKNRWLLIVIILMTIILSLWNSVSVIAETFDSSVEQHTISSEILNTRETSRKEEVSESNPEIITEIETVSTAEEKPLVSNIEEPYELFFDNLEQNDKRGISDEEEDTNESQSSVRHAFSPPSTPGPLPDVVYMHHNESTDEGVYQYIKDNYLKTRIAIVNNDKLGKNIGDFVNIKILSNTLAHFYIPMPWNAPWKQAESWYGYIQVDNLKVSNISDPNEDVVKIETTKLNDGYNLKITRVKEDKADIHNLQLEFSYVYPYYLSQYGYNGKVTKWTSWSDAGTITGAKNYLNLDVQLEPTSEALTAEAVPQEILLGSNFSNVSPYDLVKDVKLGNQVLTTNDYTVSVQNSVSTDTVGDKTAKVLITYKKDTSKTLTLEVPVQILWGYTIGSNNVIYSTSTGFSLSLITEDKPNIISTLGNGKNSGNWINDYRNGTYITTKVFKDSQLLNSEYTNPYINLAISGRDSAKNATDKWNNLSNRSEISYGDVLQYDVLTNWGDNKWVMRDEIQKFESLGKQSIYYEITKNGYRTLHLNHLETKNVTIPIYSTEEYLDEHIRDYIDLKGYSNISVKEFSQYPNTKASGQQKGKIIVEETLTTGKKVQYEYEVKFTIEDGTLEYSVPKTLTFKEFTKSKSEQTIQRMYSGDLGLKISDNRGQGKQGKWRLTAQVKQSEELSPYLIFRDGTLQDKYLNQGAVEIYSQAKQSNPTEPLNVEVSGQWTKDTGVLLKVPSKNNLSSKQYTSTITWNLVEGP